MLLALPINTAITQFLVCLWPWYILSAYSSHTGFKFCLFVLIGYLSFHLGKMFKDKVLMYWKAILIYCPVHYFSFSLPTAAIHPSPHLNKCNRKEFVTINIGTLVIWRKMSCCCVTMLRHSIWRDHRSDWLNHFVLNVSSLLSVFSACLIMTILYLKPLFLIFLVFLMNKNAQILWSIQNPLVTSRIQRFSEFSFGSIILRSVCSDIL